MNLKQLPLRSGSVFKFQILSSILFPLLPLSLFFYVSSFIFLYLFLLLSLAFLSSPSIHHCFAPLRLCHTCYPSHHVFLQSLPCLFYSHPGKQPGTKTMNLSLCSLSLKISQSFLNQLFLCSSLLHHFDSV